MEDKLIDEKIKLADSFSADPDRDVFGMSDEDFSKAYLDDSQDLEEKFIMQLDEIEAVEKSILERINKIKNSYNGEKLNAANYYEEKHNIDMDETLISMDYSDFKNAYGDSFKTIDLYDQKTLKELNNNLFEIRKLKNKVTKDLEDLKKYITRK